MYPTNQMFRIAQAVSVFAIGFMAFLIVVGNTTDYYTNYHFVEHVMKMDTLFPDNTIHYRSINNEMIYHAGYIAIILLEAAMGYCCLRGSWLLFRNIKNDGAAYHAVKNWSIAGLILGILIWFLGFEVIGAEWFGMWQSATWNGLNNANRIVTFITLILLSLQFREANV